MAQTIQGIQSAGVIACAKHYIGNEQEHFRQAPEAVSYNFNITDSVSSNIDDVTLHELYLWSVILSPARHLANISQAIRRCSPRWRWLYHVFLSASQQHLQLSKQSAT